MKPHHDKIGFLSSEDSIKLLANGKYAHLACQADGELYLVPITYIFDDNYIYCHSSPGKKIELMRKNPNICIQVEEKKDSLCWESVITWGKFEELKGAEATKVAKQLIKKFGETGLRDSDSLESQLSTQLEMAILFRMKIDKITGRYEGSNQLT